MRQAGRRGQSWLKKLQAILIQEVGTQRMGPRAPAFSKKANKMAPVRGVLESASVLGSPRSPRTQNHLGHLSWSRQLPPDGAKQEPGLGWTIHSPTCNTQTWYFRSLDFLTLLLAPRQGFSAVILCVIMMVLWVSKMACSLPSACRIVDLGTAAIGRMGKHSDSQKAPTSFQAGNFFYLLTLRGCICCPPSLSGILGVLIWRTKGFSSQTPDRPFA